MPIVTQPRTLGCTGVCLVMLIASGFCIEFRKGVFNTLPHKQYHDSSNNDEGNVPAIGTGSTAIALGGLIGVRNHSRGGYNP